MMCTKWFHMDQWSSLGLIHTSAVDKWQYLETYLIIRIVCSGDEG